MEPRLNRLGIGVGRTALQNHIVVKGWELIGAEEATDASGYATNRTSHDPADRAANGVTFRRARSIPPGIPCAWAATGAPSKAVTTAIPNFFCIGLTRGYLLETSRLGRLLADV
jgi:hypothetical protein